MQHLNNTLSQELVALAKVDLSTRDEYVAAYVEYTHYVERLQMDAQGHATENHEHGHK